MIRQTFLHSIAASALAALLLAAAPASAQVAPNLGDAGVFAVLAGSAITNTGPSVVFGDVGISPGTAVSGFPPGVFSGTLHVADAVALGAQDDLVIAYDVAAGQAFDTDLSGQDLGGMTLTPGVYRFASSAQLTGTLTFDAQGDAAAVFIIQVGSTLTTASNAVVQVINGGSGCNVFWQIVSSATLGTTTEFVGNLLALTSITLNTGANVAGRLLARNGAVTLDSNTVAACGSAGVACPSVTLTPSTLPAAIRGQAYDQLLVASGGTAPYLFVVTSGSLPPGISLASSGQLSGTPTGAGSFAFTVQATDAGGCSVSQAYTVAIGQPAATMIPTVPPLGLLLLAGVLGGIGWLALRRTG